MTKSTSEALRAAATRWHRAIESSAYLRALAGGRASLVSFVGHLRGIALLGETLELAFGRASDPEVVAFGRARATHLDRLRDDLRFLEPRLVPDLVLAEAEAQRLARRIRTDSVARPLALVGYAYVLDGSALGAETLLRAAAEAYALTPSDGLSYLASLAESAPSDVADLRRRLDALVLTDEQQGTVLEAASELGAGVHAMLTHLHPPGEVRHLATSINVEAGMHAVPQDPAELAAALAAADDCWAEFPYLERRFGERGRRFTRSDGAWLATLVTLSPERTNGQIDWLARVLAARGLPSLLLQRHLQCLVARMLVDVPRRAGAYAGLSAAAERMASRREASLDAASVDALVHAFVGAAKADDPREADETARLLLAAVQDEAAGLPRAVESVSAYFEDPTRFDTDRCAAVAGLVVAARHRVVVAQGAGSVGSYGAGSTPESV